VPRDVKIVLEVCEMRPKYPIRENKLQAVQLHKLVLQLLWKYKPPGIEDLPLMQTARSSRSNIRDANPWWRVVALSDVLTVCERNLLHVPKL
jgi:hypothetical protein